MDLTKLREKLTYTAKRLNIPDLWIEDAVQEGLLLAWRKREHLKSDQSWSVKAKHGLIDWLRLGHIWRIRLPRALYESYRAKNGRLPEVYGSVEKLQVRDPKDSIRQVELKILVQDMLKVLPKRQAYILRNSVMTGGRLVDWQIAEELNVSPSRVSQLRQEGIETLRDRFDTLAA
jgi:RNA polymerase sigma factor (sigma-70 family)